MLVIGDEILSGRTRDANTHHLAQRLATLGIDLKEARVVSDDQDSIVSAIQTLSATFTHVFTSGGIGPTHDDITADCVAAAFETPIDVRPDARAILEAHYAARDTDLNAQRLRMARIPDGAALIANPVSGAPGFSLENVHVMAGVPKIFEAMLDSLLPGLAAGQPVVTASARVLLPEGELAGPLGDLTKTHPDVTFGSYPFNQAGQLGAEIVIRGADQALVAAAETALRIAFAGSTE